METDFTAFVAFIASLILLAATSMRFGADSRDGLSSSGRDQARGGIV
jgi:hypothetical protein